MSKKLKIIAEAGVNHNGKLKYCLKLILVVWPIESVETILPSVNNQEELSLSKMALFAVRICLIFSLENLS